MTNIEIRVHSIFDTLSPVEKKVATYFLEHTEGVFRMPIARLAAVSDVTPVAWVRFSKTLGFDGLKELKKQLFSELNAQIDPSSQQETLYTDISGQTTVEEMIETVRTSSVQAVKDTMKLLDANVVREAAFSIIKSNSIKLFGVGASALVAEDFYEKLLRIGMNVVFCRDNHAQLTYAANLTSKDTAIFISHSGCTQEVVETLRIAKEHGALIITITKFGRSPLVTEADYALFMSCPEVYRRSGAMSSRIAQLVVVDVLYTAIAHLDYHKVKKLLENSYNSCKAHRIGADGNA